MNMYSDQNKEDEVVFEEKPPKVRKGKRWYKRWWGVLLLIILGLVLALLIAFAFQVFSIVNGIKSSGQGTPTAFLGNRIDIHQIIQPDDPFFGPADAKVTVVEFSDFQCPFCKQAYPVVNQLKKDFENQIRFVYKDFPLSDVHPDAVKAAEAAQCANEQGLFWPMHDIIFENQDALTESDLKRYAIQAGLNSIQFGSCLQSGQYFKSVENDLNEGIALGVRSTPTFFINGVQVTGAVPLAVLRGMIVAELNR